MTMRGCRLVVVAATLLLFIGGRLYADDVPVAPADYTGARSTSDSPATLVATNTWDGSDDNGFRIGWAITDPWTSVSGLWEYSFTISGATWDEGTQSYDPLSQDLSHWILEISNLEDLGISFSTAFPGWNTGGIDPTPELEEGEPKVKHKEKEGNPGMLAELYGLKWEAESVVKSSMPPVWGNFYAKDGGGKKDPVIAYNWGFTTPPTAALVDEHDWWIPRPDSEPTTGGPIADWGDLPDSYDTLAPDGPHHIDGSNEWLGTLWDDETNGAPSGDANADDMDPLTADDEDGVEFVDGGVYVTISVADRDGGRYDDTEDAGLWPHHIYLDGWIDLDQDGTFDELDDSDHVVGSEPGGWHVNPADAAEWGTTDDTATFFFPVDGWAPGFGPEGTGYYSRWRLSYGAPTTWTGEALYGEVEDYWVTPEPVTFVLFGLPLAVLARRRRRTR